jgi:hypothetical protein
MTRNCNKTEDMKGYMKEYNKRYYKEKLEKYREKVICACGSEVNKYGLSEHEKSNKHKLLVENKELKLQLSNN